MISSASLLLLATVAVGPDSLPAALVSQVRAWIGREWGVPAESVQLEWGRHVGLDETVATAPLRVGGSGRNGWFVVTVEPPDAPPAAVTVRAGTLALQPVAARALSAGTRLAAEDIVLAEQVAWGPPPPAPEANPLPVGEGWEVRRAIAQGTVLVPPLVQAPRLVVSGDPVTFVWTRGAIRMERVAIAQGSARLGELVHAQVGTVRLAGVVTGPRTALIAQERQP
ncbi:MAG: flagella basal body P-ring formation protein FlgA [Gemmatimonadales bacterium]|nr:flagella basal body P-ring formation protein FlgA [Gemmatimonadales bacterium]